MSAKTLFKKCFTSFVCCSFVLTSLLSPAYAQAIMNKGMPPLPEPGSMVGLSGTYNPPMLRGIKVFTDNPLKFDFILDSGDEAGKLIVNNKIDDKVQAELKETSNRLIKYFLTTLTVPDEDIWVNLSPYEKDRIATDKFGQTEMGRDVLAQDYLLKQLTASLLFPQGEVGKKFWAKIYAEAQKKSGTTDIPLDTFNKVWIMPAKAVVYEKVGNSKNADNQAVAYVVESRLKVMLESDYLAKSNNPVSTSQTLNVKSTPDINTPVSINNQEIEKNVLREIIIPLLEKEVNEGENFTQLRQVYNSILLALWYKEKVKGSILSSAYVNHNKVAGVEADDKAIARKIWNQYVEAFKKGAVNVITEETDPMTNEVIPRKYFSGGFNVNNAQSVTQYLSKFPSAIGAALLGGLMLITSGVNPASAGSGNYMGNNGITVTPPLTNPATVELSPTLNAVLGNFGQQIQVLNDNKTYKVALSKEGVFSIERVSQPSEPFSVSFDLNDGTVIKTTGTETKTTRFNSDNFSTWKQAVQDDVENILTIAIQSAQQYEAPLQQILKIIETMRSGMIAHYPTTYSQSFFAAVSPKFIWFSVNGRSISLNMTDLTLSSSGRGSSYTVSPADMEWDTALGNALLSLESVKLDPQENQQGLSDLKQMLSNIRNSVVRFNPNSANTDVFFAGQSPGYVKVSNYGSGNYIYYEALYNKRTGDVDVTINNETTKVSTFSPDYTNTLEDIIDQLRNNQAFEPTGSVDKIQPLINQFESLVNLNLRTPDGNYYANAANGALIVRGQGWGYQLNSDGSITAWGGARPERVTIKPELPSWEAYNEAMIKALNAIQVLLPDSKAVIDRYKQMVIAAKGDIINIPGDYQTAAKLSFRNNHLSYSTNGGYHLVFNLDGNIVAGTAAKSMMFMAGTDEYRLYLEQLRDQLAKAALQSPENAAALNKYYELVDNYLINPTAHLDHLFIQRLQTGNPDSDMTKLIEMYAPYMDVSKALESLQQKDNAEKMGGIDLKKSTTPLNIQNNGGTIKFNIDPAMIERINAAPGFTPQVFTISPLQSLPAFLGMSKEEATQVAS